MILTQTQTQAINQGFFNLKQCTYSNIAHINEINNNPGSDYILDTSSNLYDPSLHKDDIILNLHRLFKYCINPIFRKFGSRNLFLTSVYRNKKLNKLLKGVENSQHIYGYAADIVVTNTNTAELFNWCSLNIPRYHQLIWEYPERGDFSSPLIEKNTNPDNLSIFNDRNVIFQESSSLQDIIPPNFSWIHISFIKGNNEKINSVSSMDPEIHNAYKDENTFYLDNFTHRIAMANQQILK